LRCPQGSRDPRQSWLFLPYGRRVRNRICSWFSTCPLCLWGHIRSHRRRWRSIVCSGGGLRLDGRSLSADPLHGARSCFPRIGCLWFCLWGGCCWRGTCLRFLGANSGRPCRSSCAGLQICCLYLFRDRRVYSVYHIEGWVLWPGGKPLFGDSIQTRFYGFISPPSQLYRYRQQ
jgi:hypothetical protein